MFAALVDHLWQSVLVLMVLALGAVLARGAAAHVRLWMWRIAALKFLVPFHLLFVFGGWLGYPIRNPDDTAPDFLTQPLASLAPYLVPAQARDVDGWALAACVILILAAVIPCARSIHYRLSIESWRHSTELARLERDPDDSAPGLGFFRGMLFTTVTMVTLVSPVLAGAVDDRLTRRELLLEDARALRDARIEMKPAAPGMGQRVRLSARANGMFIRNATIQDLAAFAYGVNRFFVRGDHFYEAGERDWLIDARYDIFIEGRIRDPDRFDTYAVRVPVTRMLAQRHGLEIYVNSECQPPCGRYGVAIPKEGL
jgi:hypothetical protein